MPVKNRRMMREAIQSQQYAMLSSASESTDWYSRDEDDAETRVESLWSTSDYNDHDEEPNDLQYLFGAVKKTIQNTAGLLGGYDDSSVDVSTEYDEDSRVLSSIAADSTIGASLTHFTTLKPPSGEIEPPSPTSEIEEDYEEQEDPEVPSPKRACSYLTFKQRPSIPLKPDDEGTPVRRNHRPASTLTDSKKSPVVHASSSTPTTHERTLVSPKPSRVSPCAPRRNSAKPAPQIIEAVISQDEHDSVEDPLFSAWKAKVQGSSLEPTFGGYRRPASRTLNTRRTKLGDLSWEGQSCASRSRGGDSQKSNLINKAMNSREEQSVHQMNALADITTPHSTATTETRRRASENGQPSICMPIHEKDLAKDVNPDRESEENEIVFDALARKSSENSGLFDDGSVWNLEEEEETDEEFFPTKKIDRRKLKLRSPMPEKTQTTQLSRTRTAAPEAPKTIIEKVSCTSSKIEQPKKESLPQVSDSLVGMYQSANVDKRHSIAKGAFEAKQEHMNIVQQLNRARCGRFPSFDENKLRAIVETESVAGGAHNSDDATVTSETVLPGTTVKRKPTVVTKYGRKSQKDTFQEQLISFGQRAACMSIPAVDSLKGSDESPKIPLTVGVKQRPTLNLELKDIRSPAGNKSQLYMASKVVDTSRDTIPFLSPTYASAVGMINWMSTRKEETDPMEAIRLSSTRSDMKSVEPKDAQAPNIELGDEESIGSAPFLPKDYETKFGDSWFGDFPNVFEGNTPVDTFRHIPQTESANGSVHSHRVSKEMSRESTSPRRKSPVHRALNFFSKGRASPKFADGSHRNTPTEASSTHAATDIPASVGITLPVKKTTEHSSPETDRLVIPLPSELPRNKHHLVSALKKTNFKPELKVSVVAAHGSDNNSDNVEKPRIRRVMFSEKVEENIIERRNNDSPSNQPDIWGANNFIEAYALRALRTCVNEDFDYDDDVDSITPVADFSVKREVALKTPDDLAELFVWRNSECLLSPASDSKPLLPATHEASEIVTGPKKLKGDKKLVKESEIPTEQIEMTQEEADPIISPRSSVKPRRFRLFGPKKDAKRQSPRHTRESKVPSKWSSQYQSLESNTFKDENERNVSVEAATTQLKQDINKKDKEYQKPNLSDRIARLRSKRVQKEESKDNAEDNSAPEASTTVNEDNDVKKKKLRLKILNHRRNKSKEPSAVSIESHDTVTSDVDQGKQIRAKSCKKRNRKLFSKRVLAKSDAQRSNLSAIPEEESTRADSMDSSRSEPLEVKTVKPKRKRSFRNRLFGRKDKKEGALIMNPSASDLYARRKEERLQREKEEIQVQESHDTAEKKSQAHREVYAWVDFPSTNGMSSLPPVMVVPAERTRNTPEQDESKHTYGESAPSYAEETVPQTIENTVSPTSLDDDTTTASYESESSSLFRLERDVTRQMMQDLMLLAKLEKQRSLLEQGGKTSEMSQKALKSVVARVEGSIAEANRIRAKRSRSYVKRRTEYDWKNARRSFPESLCTVPCHRQG